MTHPRPPPPSVQVNASLAHLRRRNANPLAPEDDAAVEYDAAVDDDEGDDPYDGGRERRESRRWNDGNWRGVEVSSDYAWQMRQREED